MEFLKAISYIIYLVLGLIVIFKTIEVIVNETVKVKHILIGFIFLPFTLIGLLIWGICVLAQTIVANYNRFSILTKIKDIMNKDVYRR